MAKKKSKPAAASTAVAVATCPEPKGTPTIKRIPIDSIYIDGENHRLADDYEEKVRARAESFRYNGQQSPVIVSMMPSHPPHKLCDGHIRVDAAKLLGWTTIVADVRGAISLEEFADIRAITALHVAQLNVVEKMKAVRNSVNKHGGDELMAAEKLQLKPAEVKDLIYIDQRIFEPARKLAAEGKLLHGHLRVLAKVGDPERQKQLAEDCVEGGSEWMRGIGRQRIEGDGAISRWSVATLEKMVQLEQRKLSLVPWILDQAFAGKPACDGCNHNTSKDQTLFGNMTDDKGNGVCMNLGCFEAKTKAAEKSKESAAARMVKMKDASAAAATSICPPFLKSASVQRLAKKQLEPAKPREAASVEEGQRAGAPKAIPGKKKFMAAYNAWHKEVDRKICEVAESDAMLAAGLLLAGEAVGCDTTETGEYGYGEPIDFLPMTEAQERMIQDIRARTASGLDECLKAYVKNGVRWLFDQAMRGLGTHGMEVLARGLGIAVEPPPLWKDFKGGADAPKPVATDKGSKPAKAGKKAKAKKELVTAGGGGDELQEDTGDED